MTKQTHKEYQEDFYAWTLHNAKLLREGRWSEADVEHIAEEMESMGKSEKRELLHKLAVLMAHLLKWQNLPFYSETIPSSELFSGKIVPSPIFCFLRFRMVGYDSSLCIYNPTTLSFPPTCTSLPPGRRQSRSQGGLLE